MGVLFIPPLPSMSSEDCLQQGALAPRALPRFLATAHPSATLSPSTHFPVLPVIGSTLLQGFLPGTRRASPVARHALANVPSLSPRRSSSPLQPVCGVPCCLHPTVAGSASRASHFRGHLCVHLRYGPLTRSHPYDDLVDRLQSLGFPPPCYPSYGASGFYPGRTFSC
jgi:hypothetical protein